MKCTSAPRSASKLHINPKHYDQPIYFDFLDNNEVSLRLKDAVSARGSMGNPLEFDGTVLTITKTNYFTENDGNNYYFVLNSRKALSNTCQKYPG